MSDCTDSPATPPVPVGLHRYFAEFLWFGLKEGHACPFAGLFFGAVFLMPRTDVLLGHSPSASGALGRCW